MNFPVPGFVILSLLRTASLVGAIVAPMLVNGKKVERIKNIPYGTGPFQRLDVYLPRNRAPEDKLPISLFIHGGGFRFFSKDSHAAAAARLAESGRIVFAIDYRVTPKDPFPAGLTDAAVAYTWMVENAARFGGDLARISMIGESSGAGFIASLSLYLFGLRGFPKSVSIAPPPAAKPKAVILHCGYYEVSDVERFRDDARCHRLAQTRVRIIRQNYLPDFARGISPDWALADPLVAFREIIESGAKLPADFPEFFVPVGERDPVIGDSERLADAMAKLGQTDRLRVYSGVGHAFYVAPAGDQAKRCWADIVNFLDRAKA